MRNEAFPQQLTLLPSSPVSARFLLSRETRERGLRHVAEIREMLASRRGAEHTGDVVPIRPRTDRAA